MSDCSVCTESFTDYTRKKISCGYCSYNACKSCVSRYLLSQVVDAHCMNCRTGWNREFIDEHMTKSFRTGLWRDHRKNMIVQREKALLPNYQKYASAKKKMIELEPIMYEARIEEQKINDIRIKNSNNHHTIRTNMLSDPSNDERYISQLKSVLIEQYELAVQSTIQSVKTQRIQEEYNVYYNIYNGTVKHVEKREFIMKCVKEGCRGFLSQSYKCDLCSTYVCKDCMIVKKERDDNDHVCKKEDVDTVSMIRKDTRPCPKCGIRISKIDGCNQMWCTAEGCGTAFDWITGKIVSGVVHNPHYYEWLRRNNNGAPPRNVGDIPCGGVPQIHLIINAIRNIGLNHTQVKATHPHYTSLRLLIHDIHRCFTDLEYVRVPQYNMARDENLLKEIHIDYLLTNIDEAKWKQSMFLKETNLEKKQLIGQVLNTFLNAGADIMRTTVDTFTQMENDKKNNTNYKINEITLAPLLDNIQQFETLRAYINETFVKLAETASMAVPQFDEHWSWVTPSSLERIKNAAKEVSKNQTPTT